MSDFSPEKVIFSTRQDQTKSLGIYNLLLLLISNIENNGWIKREELKEQLLFLSKKSISDSELSKYLSPLLDSNVIKETSTKTVFPNGDRKSKAFRFNEEGYIQWLLKIVDNINIQEEKYLRNAIPAMRLSFREIIDELFKEINNMVENVSAITGTEVQEIHIETDPPLGDSIVFPLLSVATYGLMLGKPKNQTITKDLEGLGIPPFLSDLFQIPQAITLLLKLMTKIPMHYKRFYEKLDEVMELFSISEVLSPSQSDEEEE